MRDQGYNQVEIPLTYNECQAKHRVSVVKETHWSSFGFLHKSNKVFIISSKFLMVAILICGYNCTLMIKINTLYL